MKVGNECEVIQVIVDIPEFNTSNKNIQTKVNAIYNFNDLEYDYDSGVMIQKYPNGKVYITNELKANFIGMIPFLKDVYSLIEGYDVTNMAYTGLTNVVNGMKEMYNIVDLVVSGEKYTDTEIRGKIRKTLIGLSQTFGIPLRNLETYTKGIIEKFAPSFVYMWEDKLDMNYGSYKTDLTNAIEWYLKPLEYLKIKTSIFAMMISIALRFIPTLFNETNKILKAQASRGVDFNEGKFMEQVKQIVSLLIPMFVISIKRAEDLADAMEARGYIPGEKRTKLVKMKFKAFDYITISFVLSLLILLILGLCNVYAL